MKRDNIRLFELYNEGLNDCEIGSILNVSSSAVGINRRKLGLLPNANRGGQKGKKIVFDNISYHLNRNLYIAHVQLCIPMSEENFEKDDCNEEDAVADDEEDTVEEKVLNKKLTTEERLILEGDDIVPSKKKIKITPAVKQKLMKKLTAEQIEELKKTDYHHIMFLKQFTSEERKVIYRLCLSERLNKTEATIYVEIQKKLKEDAYDKNFIADVYCNETEREAIEGCIRLNNTEIEILAILVRKKLLSEE